MNVSASRRPDDPLPGELRRWICQPLFFQHTGFLQELRRVKHCYRQQFRQRLSSSSDCGPESDPWRLWLVVGMARSLRRARLSAAREMLRNLASSTATCKAQFAAVLGQTCQLQQAPYRLQIALLALQTKGRCFCMVPEEEEDMGRQEQMQEEKAPYRLGSEGSSTVPQQSLGQLSLAVFQSAMQLWDTWLAEDGRSDASGSLLYPMALWLVDLCWPCLNEVDFMVLLSIAQARDSVLGLAAASLSTRSSRAVEQLDSRQ